MAIGEPRERHIADRSIGVHVDVAMIHDGEDGNRETAIHATATVTVAADSVSDGNASNAIPAIADTVGRTALRLVSGSRRRARKTLIATRMRLAPRSWPMAISDCSGQPIRNPPRTALPMAVKIRARAHTR